ncbi:MAG: amidohydrolase family protein [Desulfotignum sp.]|nr:amidohydrolase family protein [Desulfotignum sp.]
MIIDTHTHLFPDAFVQDRSRLFADEPEFTLLYKNPNAKMATCDQLIQAMDRHQVNIACATGFPWKNPDHARANNDYIISCVQRFPDRIRGLACFDLEWRGAADEAVRCIEAGLSGVGELAFYLSGIDKRALDLMGDVMAVLREKGNLPCMIHTNEPVGHAYPGKTPVTLEQIQTLAGTFADNRIILAHWGGGIFFYHVMKKQLKQTLTNIWYDTAASPFLYDPAIYDMADQAGVLDKVLFGTDFPLLPPDRYYRDLDASGLDKEKKQAVLGENAAMFYA